MPAPVKIEQLNELKAILNEKQNFVLTTYSGLSVTQISDLRAEVREKNARLKVIKNNLFYRALKEIDGLAHVADDVRPFLEGPVAVTFVDEDFPATSKVLVEYAKKSDKVQIKSGCMEGEFLKKTDVENIANLPSKDELLGIIGRGLNTPAQKIAVGMNQIIASLGRGIKAVGEKNG
ncbi:MAG: 50S ribosomal protein L10 [Leptospiraceae bacterium]|nr:50S ribosomal protein L10 [Leptospiraceae bacterium]